jgi:anti-sigma regulatory factor (Ser/Thr protein kinase)
MSIMQRQQSGASGECGCFQKDEEAFVSLDLSALVQEVVDILKPKWKLLARDCDIHIQVQYKLELTRQIKGSRAELYELLTNLFYNASDAMPEGGCLTVLTRESGESGVLEVQDTGVGMTEQVRQRCLEPFFTTKGKRGNGIGLSMVNTIVKRHGGTLQIGTKAGEGTVFRVLLPFFEERQQQAQLLEAAHEASESPKIAPVHVLFIPQKITAKRDLVIQLEDLGYAVCMADSCKAGLGRFTPDKHKMVFLETGKQDMPCERVIRVIKLMAPNTPVVGIVGDSFEKHLFGWGQSFDLLLKLPITAKRLNKAMETLCMSSSN